MAPIYEASSFWDLVEQRAATSADDRFLLQGDDTVVTFGQFRDRVERVAAGLAERGIVEGTPVVWQLPTAIDSIVAATALSRLGAVQTPIIHLYREKEVGFCIDQAKPAMVIVPGTWGGHDYVAMVEGLVGPSTADRPQILAIDQGLPEGDP
ncbi:MAG: AMP-binding protein, partial [Acidimicrobiales bacterium]|nr:AMP-binding protein [Acidimicrobiales bacterium]